MIKSDDFDPRDAWSHARRIELARYARECGHPEITELLPKEVIVRRLKALGLPAPNVPLRPLVAIGDGGNPRAGDTSPTSHRSAPIPAVQTAEVEIDADELLEQEYAARPMTYNEMRAELKKRGVKLDRKWTKDDVRKMLSG